MWLRAGVDTTGDRVDRGVAEAEAEAEEGMPELRTSGDAGMLLCRRMLREAPGPAPDPSPEPLARSRWKSRSSSSVEAKWSVEDPNPRLLCDVAGEDGCPGPADCLRTSLGVCDALGCSSTSSKESEAATSATEAL